MKNTKKIGIIVSLVLAFGIFLAGGIGLASFKTADAATVENVYIQDEYAIDKVFTFPKAQIKVGDKTVNSDYAYIIYPSGKAKDKSPVVLDEEGVYTLVYTATVDGKKVTAKKEFVVEKQVYKVDDPKSSVYYGSHTDMLALEGVVVALANGDTFVYDEIIDLSDNTKSDVLFKFALPTSSKGKPDVGEMAITFTDVYDENNYFTIYVKNVAEYGEWALSQSYITAGAVNQTAGGWENAPKAKMFHTNNEYGFPVRFSMASKPSDAATGYDVLSFFYDANTKAVYTNNAIYSGDNMIADFDDSDTFLKVWGGFSTGKVRLSIKGISYKAELMHAVIAQIDGNAPAKAVSTDTAPIIEVDVDEEDVPYALVGKEYKIFDATAFDAHEGYKDIKTNVYYNYGKSNQTVCGIVDGKFIPKHAGVYTIVYSAKDGVGQVAKKEVNVESFDHSGLSVELVNPATTVSTGREVVLFEGWKLNNASGEASVTVDVDGSIIEPKLGKYTFLPFKNDTYTVTVTVSDYVSTVVKTFEMTSTLNLSPQIFEAINLPKRLIKGEEFVLPTITGYDFKSGVGVECETKIFVKENGGAEKEIVGNKYTPSQEGRAEIIYRVIATDGTGRSNAKSVFVDVVSVNEDGDLHIEKFFIPQSGDVVAEAKDSYIALTANKDSSVEFLNRVQVKDFYMTFVFDKEFNKVGKVNIYFTDVTDPSKRVKFTYSKSMNGGASFSVNGGASVNVESSFTSDSKNFMLTYSDGVVYGSSTVYFPVEKYLDGSEFKGFTGDLAYLTIEMQNVSSKSVMCLKNLNRQSLNNSTKDRVAPQILADAIVGDRTINDVIVIKDALSADVLSSSWSFRLSVIAPDGNFAVAKDGTVLNGEDNDPSGEYELILASYGDYYIEFYASDTSGKENIVSYYVTVKDSVAPEVKLYKSAKTAIVGETVTIAQFIATDNISETLSSFICVEAPDYTTIAITNNQFVAEMAGKYTVKYMVWDEVGNYTFKSYVITVS